MNSPITEAAYDPANPAHNPATRDYSLFTDGSGHQDGYSGAAALVISNKQNQVKRLVRAENGSTVARAEMYALLLGLNWIADAAGIMSPEKLKGLKPSVFWLTDRLDLALTLRGKCDPKKNLDLWCSCRWFCSFLDVQAFYTKRLEHPYNTLADELAGNARVLVKDLSAYLE